MSGGWTSKLWKMEKRKDASILVISIDIIRVSLVRRYSTLLYYDIVVVI